MVPIPISEQKMKVLAPPLHWLVAQAQACVPSPQRTVVLDVDDDGQRDNTTMIRIRARARPGSEFYFSQDSFQCLSSPRSSILVLRWGSSLIAIGHLFVRICHVAASQPLIRGEFGNIFLVCPHRELCHKVNKWPFTGQINESSFVLFVFSVWG